MAEFNLIGEIIDTAVSLLGKYGRWLNIHGRRACFVVWSICVLWWIYRDFTIGFYSQGFFCILSLGFHLYGFWNWKHKGIGK